MRRICRIMKEFVESSVNAGRQSRRTGRQSMCAVTSSLRSSDRLVIRFYSSYRGAHTTILSLILICGPEIGSHSDDSTRLTVVQRAERLSHIHYLMLISVSLSILCLCLTFSSSDCRVPITKYCRNGPIVSAHRAELVHDHCHALYKSP